VALSIKIDNVEPVTLNSAVDTLRASSPWSRVAERSRSRRGTPSPSCHDEHDAWFVADDPPRVGVPGRFVDVVAGANDLTTVDQFTGSLEVDRVHISGVSVLGYDASGIQAKQ
jgi:hypothetical protein